MNQKIKTQKGFIQIPLLVVIIVSFAVISVGGYGGFKYYKTSEVIKESKQLAGEEKYKEAIEKLEVAQNSLVVKNFGLKKQEINEEIEANKKNLKDKSKFTQALAEFDEGNWKEAVDLFSEIPEDSFYFNNAKLKIEKAKRKITEKELGETKVAKKQVEEKLGETKKAKKQAEVEVEEEKTKRVQTEQKLSEKKAKEKRMNADNDTDNLTYREESSKGTSDSDSDSDGDGIVDSKDTHPAGEGRNISQTFAWSYGDHDWTLTTSIQEDWYDYYKAKPRSSVEDVEYITSDDPFIKKVSKKILESAKSGMNEVLLAVSFVQNLPYVDDVFTGYDEYPKYPIETFFEKNGDCEDTSYLTASIINAMGYDSTLILLPEHMAVGVWMDCDNSGTYYKLDDKCYYYVETTSKDFVGEKIPDRYRDTRATIIKTPSGKTANVSPQYKKPCYISPNFSDYYYDGNNYYSDSQCQNLTTCLYHPGDPGFYWDTNKEETYWDNNCTQIIVEGCYKSEKHLGYFYDDEIEYYSDSQCIQKARLCRPSPNYSDTYYDGYNEYWDSNCTQIAK